MDPLSEVGFEELRRVQLLEKNQPALSAVPADFFDSVKNFLEKQRELLQRDFSVEAAAAYQNAQKLLREISRRREKKIFLKALTDFQANSVSGEGLAREEKQLYNSLTQIISEYESSFAPKTASSAEKAEGGFVEVRLLADLPEFVGSSGQIGPFSASQVAKLPKQDALLLVEQGVAEKT